MVNRVAAGDYECAERSAEMLRELGAAFRLLNLRNDFLRKRFDGTKRELCFPVNAIILLFRCVLHTCADCVRI